MDNKQTLRDELTAKNTQIDLIVHQISLILSSIHRLSLKFNSESAKVKHRINKVSSSMPRGNPRNQWPHRPMTERIRAFYQIKDRKESQLWNSKSRLRLVFDHEKAI